MHVRAHTQTHVIYAYIQLYGLVQFNCIVNRVESVIIIVNISLITLNPHLNLNYSILISSDACTQYCMQPMHIVQMHCNGSTYLCYLQIGRYELKTSNHNF